MYTLMNRLPCFPRSWSESLACPWRVTLAISGCPVASVSWEVSAIQAPMSYQNEKKLGWHHIQVACGGVCSQIIFIYDL